MFGDLAIDLLRLLLPADTFPERRPEIQIVRDNGSMPACRSNRFDHQLWCRIAQGGKDSAGVKPADTQLAKDMLPIKIARFELAGCGVTTIGNANSASDAKAALGEIQAIAYRPPYTVIRNPFHTFHIHAALQYKILQQMAHIIVGKSRADRRLEPKATSQPSGDIIFSSAFPYFEPPRRSNPPFSRIQAEHNLAQGQEIVFTRSGRLDGQ